MCVYLRVKFVVSSIILTSFRQGVILHLQPPPPPLLPHYALSQGEPLKSPPRDNHHQKGSVSNITFINMCLV